MNQLHLKIHGHVHDVGFREITVKKANELGLVGYVKNMSDGTVEVVAEAEEETLKKLLEWCKIGPRHARVIQVDEEWQGVNKKTFNNFSIEM